MSLIRGGFIILSVILVELIAAFMVNFFTSSEGSPNALPDGCSTSSNVTVCETSSKTSFFSTLLDVSITGFDGVWPFINIVWVGGMAFLLTIGVIECFRQFGPTLPS